MEKIIEFKEVSKEFNGNRVIENLNLTINKGEIFVMVGPSGSGKTTTMKMINGLTVPTDGNVYFKEQRIKDYDIKKMRWQMGYVLQQIALFPTMTVRQNIEVIPEMLGWEKEKRHARVDQLLAQVDLDPEEYRHRLPSELSGGEQQRIGILRALAASPEVILMDEPFSALDPISRTALQELVLKIHQDLKTTIVFVTHNMKEALKLGDRIAVMREGKVLQCDTPEQILAHPESDFIEAFFEEEGEIQADFISIGLLVEDGFYEEATAAETLPQISLSETLDQAYVLLADAEKLQIVDHTQQVIGHLTSKNVFQYLSQKKGGKTHVEV
ncbi:ABC transporter ATP-binding protein [Enterococcus sp. HY326]|uniref:ABC transporter ATP-binding protein n=1 Tax=Enterococcus sp. HY326 TaxID=2971265 RepID=UPI002240BD8F|nr:ABC transporter ATP-binding protein [Enterococcus sp. HY326]